MAKHLALFLLISLFACGQITIKQNYDKKNLQITGGWKNLDQKNYSIQCPVSRELNQSGQMGMSFNILSPRESEQDKFRENVNLVIQDMTGQGIDITKYTKISKEQIKLLLTNSNVLESKRIKKTSDEYQKII